MKTSLRRLRPKDFDAALLEKLTKQGRVYIDIPQVKNDDVWKHEVLNYVRAISDYATEVWKERIDWLWKTIVDEAHLREVLIMKRGLQTGHMNRYVVTNIVYRMRSGGVYRSDVPMLTLHLRMEGTDKKNKYYTSCGNYTLEREMIRQLRELLARV